jgi:hypothetical protein
MTGHSPQRLTKERRNVHLRQPNWRICNTPHSAASCREVIAVTDSETRAPYIGNVEAPK